MTEELKKEELVAEEENNEIENEVTVDDYLNVNISLDDINDLTIEECDILAVKVEIAIDKCEDQMDKLIITEDEKEYEKLSEEYKRLKHLDRVINKHKKSIQKGTKEGGLFGNLPIWAFVLFLVCAIFTIIPINPYFPVKIYVSIADKFGDTFSDVQTGIYLFYFMYIGLFLFIEIVLFVILLIKGLKSKEKMATFKSYLFMFIINILIDIPGVVIFLEAALR